MKTQAGRVVWFLGIASMLVLDIHTPVLSTAATWDTDPFQKRLEQATVDFLVTQLHLESGRYALSISSAEILSDTARIDVQLQTASPEFGPINERIHVFALHNGEEVQRMFREPSLEFLQYAADLSPKLLPPERLRFWVELHQREVALKVGAVTDDAYRLPFTGGTQETVYQNSDKHFDFGGPGWIARAARGGQALNSVDSYGAYYTRIQHVDGTYGWYLHFQANSWFIGTVGSIYYVEQGGCLALTDSTGQVYGPHLHFNVTPAWNTTNDAGCNPLCLDPPYWLAVNFVEGTIPTGGALTPISQNSSAPCGNLSCCGCGLLFTSKTSGASATTSCSASSPVTPSRQFSFRSLPVESHPIAAAAPLEIAAAPSIPTKEILPIPAADLAAAPPGEPAAVAAARAPVEPLRKPPVSANYAIPKSVFGSGGGPKTSASYRLQGTSGQTSGTGALAGASYQLHAGYWAGRPTPPTPNTPTATPTVTKTPTATARATNTRTATPIVTITPQLRIYLPLIVRR